MLLTTFLRGLATASRQVSSRLFSQSSRWRNVRAVRRRGRRSDAEALEVRTLLAAVSWDGGGGDSDWQNGLNWSNDAVPTSADDVTITSSSVNLTSSVILNTLTLTSSTINVSAAVSISADQMAINAGSAINAGANTLTLSQKTSGRAINLGVAASGSELLFSDANLDSITAGTLTIGSPLSGAITVNRTISHANHLSLSSGGGIIFDSQVAMATDKNFAAVSISTSTGITFVDSGDYVDTFGTGTIEITSARNVTINVDSGVTSEHGGITVNANQQVTATSGNFSGVNVKGGAIFVTGSGPINVRGRGGNSGVSCGVLVDNGGVIRGGISGLTRVERVGGLSTSTGNAGVSVSGSTSSITSIGGNIQVTGTGGGTGNSERNNGVLVSFGSISASGIGTVTVNGQGSTTISGTSSLNHGIFVASTGSVSAVDGRITLVGTGGFGSVFGGSRGVYLFDNSRIRSTGSGGIDVTGQGGSNGRGNSGVLVDRNSSLLVDSGLITVNGTGGTGSDFNYGLLVLDSVIDGGATGDILLRGTGGIGGNENTGILLDRSFSVTTVTTMEGSLSLIGTAVATTGTGHIGVVLQNSALVRTTGSGNVIVSGTGTRGNGVWMYNAAGIETTSSGSLSISGQSGSTPGTSTGFRDGVELRFGSFVRSTSTASNAGAITIQGTGGSAPTSDGLARGIILEAWDIATTSTAITPVTSVNGNISITGLGGNQSSRPDNAGVVLARGGRVDSTGTATITINGTAGTSSGAAMGVLVAGNSNSRILASASTVTITGQGGSGAAGYSNHGIAVFDGASLTAATEMTLTGTAGSGIGYNNGILIAGSGVQVTTPSTLTMNGTGGTGSTGNLSMGISIVNSAVVNAGTFNATGQGGFSNGGVNFGFEIYGSAVVNATNATINATAGTGGGDNWGFRVSTSGRLNVSNTLNVTGAGGNGTFNNFGVGIDASAAITTGTGLTTINATGANQGQHSVGMRMFNYGSITVGSGGMNVTATGGNTTQNDNFGMWLNDSASITTTSGNVKILGRAVDTNDTNGLGFALNEAAQMVTNGSGTITVNGQGTTGTGFILGSGAFIRSTSTAANPGQIIVNGTSVARDGVFVDGYVNTTTNSPTYIRSVNGNISVTGIGSTTTNTNQYTSGVVLWRKGQIESTGTATITVNGTGGNGVSWNRGVVVSAVDSFIRSTTGNITITGRGGNGQTSGDGSWNFGVRVEGGAAVQALGTARLTIDGTGGTGTNFNPGVSIWDAGTVVSTNSGTMSITGRGGSGNGAWSDCDGIHMAFSPRVASVSGDMTIVGIGGTGTGSDGSNDGILIAINSIVESTGPAKLTLNGIGGTGRSSNAGVKLESSAVIRATSATAGPLSIMGQGGSGAGRYHEGIVSYGGPSITTVGSVPLTLNGTGGASTAPGLGEIRGVFLSSGTVVQTANGLLTLTGQGGSGAGALDGILLADANTVVRSTHSAGVINVTGTGGNGTDIFNRGVTLLTGSKIVGAADMTITGTGGTGNGFAEGIVVTHANSEITSSVGTITVNGIGGTGGAENHGVHVYIGGQINATGSAQLTINGFAGNGAGTSQGILVSDMNSRISTTRVAILNGNATAVTSGDGNSGIRISNSAQLVGAIGRFSLNGVPGVGDSHGIELLSNGRIETRNAITTDTFHLEDSGTTGINGGTSFHTRTPTLPIVLGTEDSALGLALSSAELNRITGPWLEVGDYNEGDGGDSGIVLGGNLEISGIPDFYLYAGPNQDIDLGPFAILAPDSNVWMQLTNGDLIVSDNTGIDIQASYYVQIQSWYGTGATIGSAGRSIGLAFTTPGASGALGMDAGDDGSVFVRNAGTLPIPIDGISANGTGVLSLEGGEFSGGENAFSESVLMLANGTSLTVDNDGWSNRLVLLNGSISGSGYFETDNGFELHAGTISIPLTGPGGVTKVGSGTATLSGASSYAGSTHVSNGTLVLTGSAASPNPATDYIVDAGTVLDTAALDGGLGLSLLAGQSISGSGTIAGSLQNGGEVTPGNSPGRLSITDDFTANSNGVFVAELNGTDAGAQYDQLVVSGTVQLDGVLEIRIAPGFDPDSSMEFVILRNDGVDPVAGQFSGYPENVPFQIGDEFFLINYSGGDGNDVVLRPVIVVSNTNDSGLHSLRRGLEEANFFAGPDWIMFQIPGFGPHVIETLSPLPMIEEELTIDATTQPNWLNAGTVVVRGQAGQSGAEPEVDGFVIDAGHVSIRGLGITNFTGDGIAARAGSLSVMQSMISGNLGDGIDIAAAVSSVLIEDSLIGLDATGSGDFGNQQRGVVVVRDDSSPDNALITVSLTTVSGNAQGGFEIRDQRTSPTNTAQFLVSSSYFGTDRDSHRAIPNGVFGMKVEQFVAFDDSPGTAIIENSTFSGNDGIGLWFENIGWWGVTDSKFGTDSTGSFAIPNQVGWQLRNVTHSWTQSNENWTYYENNFVSGNRGAGIRMIGDDPTREMDIEFFDVKVGTDITGNEAIPNSVGISADFDAASYAYVYIYGQVSGNNGPGIFVGGTSTETDFEIDAKIGTNSAGDEGVPNRGHGVLVTSDAVMTTIYGNNPIAFNRGAGIRFEGAGDGRNVNIGRAAGDDENIPRFFANQGLAIDLGGPGPTEDTGAATDRPVIVVAQITDVGFLDVVGTNPANGGYFIQFYASKPTVTGRGQGDEPIGTYGQLAGMGIPQGLLDEMQFYPTPIQDLDLRPDHFRFRISVPENFDRRLLTAVMVDPRYGYSGFDYAGISEFSPIVPIGTQLTHLPPVVDAGSSQQLFADQTLTRTIGFRDEDSVEFDVVVDYGDGSGTQSVRFRPQDRVIFLEHTYRKVGQFVVSVTVLDDTQPIPQLGFDSFIVTVINTPPEIRFNEVALTKRVREGELVNLQGLFDDAGLTDLHTVEVNWGDGTPVVPMTLPVGQRGFDLSHVYADDGVSLADAHVYRVVVTVRDEYGAASATPVFLVEVDNVLPAWPPVIVPVGHTLIPALSLSANSIIEGDSVQLSGTFFDPGLIDSHLIYVNWGDGSPREKVSLSAIVQYADRRDFSIAHQYRQNPLGGSAWTITVELSDDDAPFDVISNSIDIAVINAAPQIDFVQSGLSVAAEGDELALSVVFTDDGIEAHTVTIAWGDGSTSLHRTAPGEITVSPTPSHRYLRDGNYTITVTVSDPDGSSISESLTQVVMNAAPVLHNVLATPSGVLLEGDEITLSGSFEDDSPQDQHTIRVHWGDGTNSLAHINAINGTWSARHRFEDGRQPGSDDYIVNVDLFDGTDSAWESLSVTVLNVAPTVSVIPIVDNTTPNPVFRALAFDRSVVDQQNLNFNWLVMYHGELVTFIVRSADEIEVLLPAGSGGSGGGGGGLGIGTGPTDNLIVSLTVADDDTGVSNPWTAKIVYGTSGPDHLTLKDTDFPTGVTRIIMLGLGGDDVLDASGVTTFGRSVFMYGGSGDDLLFDGSGDDVIVLGSGNDSLNIPDVDPRNSFLDALGDPFSIIPNAGGNDEVYLVVNSVLEVHDNVGSNTLNFSLNQSAISQAVGITFDLSLTVQEESDQELAVQDVAPLSTEAATHFVAALGNFTTLIGSNFGDTLTGASHATVRGGSGNDLLLTKDGMTDGVFSGGADDDVLLNRASASISGLNFTGDDGSDQIQNHGSISSLTFGGGADDDVLTNFGTITTSLNFGGDDGIDQLVNNGSISALTFTGGADDDVLTNFGTITTSLNFGGDDGIDQLVNHNSIASLIFTGGADDDVLTNFGTITASLNFGGDDGIDQLFNNGSIVSLVFTGGADDDALVNNGAGSIASLTFTGGADDDVLTNRGTITALTFTGGADDDVLENRGSIASLTFTGGADDDVLTNFGTITTSLNFGGDDGVDQLVNGGNIATLTFTGGADDDVLVNNDGSTIASLTFTGGADDDVLMNFGTITTSLNFGGDDGIDQLQNHGSLTSLTFTGGADDDVLTNFGTITTSLNFGGDDGTDHLQNHGVIASLTFTGGADDDVLVNNGSGTIAALTFTGGADDDVLINRGAIVSLTFTGGADDDVLENHGAVATLTFTGGADDDVFTNFGTITTSLNFGGDDGSDVLVNRGSVASLTFTGGADDDVLANFGTITSSLNFGGDDGADLLVNRGSVASLTFTGGADDDVLQTGIGIIGSLNFSGDDGSDVLVNRAAGIGSLTFTGGADDDVLINRGSGFSSLTFYGGDGDDIFVNSGNASLTTPGELAFIDDDGSNAMRNEGRGWTLLRYVGGAGDDFLQNNATGLGGINYSGGTGGNAFENNASNLSSIVIIGSSDDDVVANDGNNIDGIDFTGLGGNDLFLNSGTYVRNVLFTGGDGHDRFINSGVSLQFSTFDGGDGNDRMITRGRSAYELTFIAGAGADVWLNYVGGSISTGLEMLAGAEDLGSPESESDIFVNYASSVSLIEVEGGVGDDRVENHGSSVQSVFFDGGDGDDTLLNRGHNSGQFTFIGGAGQDLLEHRGGNSGEFQLYGGDDDDTLFASSGSASLLSLIGGSGEDSLINFSHHSGNVQLDGGTGDDLLQNSGNAVGIVWLIGSSGRDLLQNFGNAIDELRITDLGFLAQSSVTLLNSGNGISSINVQSSVPTMLHSTGNDLGSLLFIGSNLADTAQITGHNIQSIVFHGNGGADSLLADVQSFVGSSLSFNGGAGQDFLRVRGSSDQLVADMGSENDLLVLTGTLATAVLNGGTGDDQFEFVGRVTGRITITESLQGTNATDTSRDLLDFSALTNGPITIDLAVTTLQSIAAATGGSSAALELILSDALGIENVRGTSGADSIFGNARPNTLTGAQLVPLSGGSSTAVSLTRTQWVLLDFDSETNPGELVYSTADRDDIVLRLQQIYTGFDVRFVQDQSQLPTAIRFDDSQFVTIRFNETPASGRPGGESSEIDPGNVNPGGSAVVQVSGMLGGREVLTPLSVAGFVQADGDEFEAPDVPKPASTPANVRALSTKIAAHELLHLLGLRHYDAWGPIGFGAHVVPGTDDFKPYFAGLVGAFESVDHIGGSPASVGSNRFNDLRALYFGERELIRLAMAFSDTATTRVNEPATPHQSQAQAAQLTLATLSVPVATGSDYSKDKTLLAEAVSVVGSIELDASGDSTSDWYKFTGRGGDVVTLEVLSRTLERYRQSSTTSIDPIVRLYDAAGQLVSLPGGLAVNDDEVESSDSLLIDVRLPNDGIYFIEIDTFRRQPGDPGYDSAVALRDELIARRDDVDPDNNLSPDEVQLLARLTDSLNDTDSGSYELLMYRVLRSNSTDGIDTLQGREGVDVLNGGSGDDYSLAGTLTGVANIAEGSSWTGTVSFSDRGGHSWQMSIDYGDGETWSSNAVTPSSSIPLSHVYADDGNFTVTVTITSDDGQTITHTLPVSVTNVAPTATLTGPTVGLTNANAVFALTAADVAGAADPLGISWTITRGSTVTAMQSGGNSFVLNTATTGVYRVSVTVNDGDGGIVTRFVDVTINLPVMAFDVASGMTQRSWINAVDTVFGTDQLAADLLANPGRVTLRRFGLSGPTSSDAGTLLSFGGAAGLTRTGSKLSLNFGNRVITPSGVNSIAADGYYRLGFDLDGNGTPDVFRHFYRLLGDATGDRRVTAADVTAIQSGFGKPYNRELDINGDNLVNNLDRYFAQAANNRQILSTLPLDD